MLVEIKDPDCEANIYGTNYIYVSTGTIVVLATLAICQQAKKLLQ